jgi:hypothetical protein
MAPLAGTALASTQLVRKADRLIKRARSWFMSELLPPSRNALPAPALYETGAFADLTTFAGLMT